ncbi:DNA-3-methyladenine glycosylase 2 family protein [Aureispira]|nr:DNA-3-methyladenine glycosylase 2 family protein [Aureispira sp.]
MYSKAINYLSKDPVLNKVITEIELISSAGNKGVYQSLLRSITSQQLSVKAAATIHRRFLELFENKDPHPQALLNKNTDELRATGLSKQKSAYMQNIANFFIINRLEGIDWINKSDTDIIDLLTQIKGVGIWTVQMILMFSLNRPDVFPTGDLGIQQAMKKLYGLKGKGSELIKEMNKIAQNWGPYKTVACRYLWKWKDK